MKSELLLLSNLVYIAPVLVILRNFLIRRVGLLTTLELLVVSMLAISSSCWYHHKRSTLLRDFEIDPEEENLYNSIPDTEHCTYTRSRNQDVMYSSLAMFFVFANLIKTPCIHRYKILAMFWVVFVVEFDLHARSLTLAFFPALLVFGWFIRSWYLSRKHISLSNHLSWSIAVAFLLMAMFFYSVQPYWLMHSLWHISGAIAASLFLTYM